MSEVLCPKPLPDDAKEVLSGLNLNLCLTCGTCASGCPATGTPGMEDWDARKLFRMLAFGMLDEVVESKFPWICTGCGRCTFACPMNVDMPKIQGFLKSKRDRDKIPGTLHQGTVKNLETGNNLGIARDDYFFTMYDMGVELDEEELPGFYVPIDKKGADILFFPNSKEVYGDFEDQIWWWKIFYAARENWTIPSKNWEAVDWGLFTGNSAATRTFAERKIALMRELETGRMIMPDCGGGSYGCRMGMKLCALDDPLNKVETIYLYDYLVEVIKQGRVKLDKSVYAGKKFTWHDSCKHARELERNFGKGYYEEPRWIIEQCVEDFVDMEPNRGNSFCCGAGGGNWPMPFEKESAFHGRMKHQSIKESGADVVVVGCSNCHDQIMKRYPKFYEDHDYEVKYIWELVADCLVIEPWTEEEVERGRAEAKAQWERLEFEPPEF